MMDNLRQLPLPGADQGFNKPLGLKLMVTLDPDGTGWGNLTEQQAVATVFDQLEELGPGVHISLEGLLQHE